MKKQTEFCLPTAGKAVPSGDDWIHEVKYDGYRMRVVRNGKTVRLFSKGGTEWTKRYPWIVETALKIKQSNFVIDGEAVILGVDGVSDFDALHSRQDDHEMQLYAFDCLAFEGDDLRPLPLHLRKTNLMQLLRGSISLPGWPACGPPPGRRSMGVICVVVVPLQRLAHHQFRPPRTRPVSGPCSFLSLSRSAHNPSIFASILVSNSSADAVDITAR